MTVNLSMLPEICLAQEVADALKVTARQVNHAAANGKIQFIKVGRQKRFLKQSIEKFIEEQLSCQNQTKAHTLPSGRKQGSGKSDGTKVDGHAAKQLALAALNPHKTPLQSTLPPLQQGNNVRPLQPQTSGI